MSTGDEAGVRVVKQRENGIVRRVVLLDDAGDEVAPGIAVEQQLIDDAIACGWQREIERHPVTKHRIEQLLVDLGR